MPVSRMQRQTTRLSDRQLAFLDKFTKDLGYRSRSETIRWIICFARNIWINMGPDFLKYMFRSTITYMLYKDKCPAHGDVVELRQELEELENGAI